MASGAEPAIAGRDVRFLVCPPDHFGVDTERNPWGASRFVAQRHLARRQWGAFAALLAERLGAMLETIEPRPTLPGMVFAANAGLVCGDRVVLSRFRHAQRRGEAAHFESWFESRGYAIERLPAGHFFEGEAEMRWWDGRFWAGSVEPDAEETQRWIARRLDAPVVCLRIVDARFGHLDTCFCPLGPGIAAYYPEAFDEPSLLLMRSIVPRLLEVPRREALRFVCNSIVAGDRVITPTGCDRTRWMLEAEGFSVWPVDLQQFRLEAGGPKCLVLRLGAA